MVLHYFRHCYLHMTLTPTPVQSLPEGPRPIWIEFPHQRFTQLNILGRVAELKEISGSSVTVLYPQGKKDKEARVFCETRNWKYHDFNSIYGLENETIIVLDSDHLSSLETIPRDSWDDLKPGLLDIVPEFISRANRNLIMVTSVNRDR